MDLLSELKKNPFVLAPMAGITDNAFRSFMRDMGCGPVVTELISANGIEYGNQKTFGLMKFSEKQHPVGIQLFGETPEVIARGAKIAQDLGCDFVDLNFGCPVPKVVNKGAGSAVLKDLVQLRNILRSVKSAITIPLTIKIRTGWSKEMRNAHQVTQVAHDEGITWVAIHGRDRAQGYSGQADWDYIAEVKAKSKVAIIGNGDIHTASKAVERLLTSGVDGVMIGRGCLKNPYIFMESMRLYQSGSNGEADYLVKNRDFRKLFENLRYFLEKDCSERVVQLQLRKFAAWFSAGYPGASNFRKNIFSTQSVSETIDCIDFYYQNITTVYQADTSSESFLMGGHG